MAKKTQKKKAKRTLASKIGVSQAVLSRKIQIVRREDRSPTAQAIGKAAGILKQRKQKGK